MMTAMMMMMMNFLMEQQTIKTYFQYKQLFADVLQNNCPQKFCYIYNKTPVFESLFSNFIKKRFQPGCSAVNIAKSLRTHFFTEHLIWLLLF